MVLEVLGYILACTIGIVMGLLGGGGSILAVPILVYLFQLDEKLATGYSLFIVGTAALIGGLQCHKDCNVDWRLALVFGIPSLIGVWIVRHYVVPSLPDVLYTYNDMALTRRFFMMGLFAVMMLLAAISMLKPRIRQTPKSTFSYPKVVSEGLLVGALTGLVGAGGGFIIVPVLVLLTDLPMKKAIGTSLIIIALKSLTGFFLGDALVASIDWWFLVRFTSLTIVGIIIGSYFSKKIDEDKLKVGFGYFILLMSVFILIMEFLGN